MNSRRECSVNRRGRNRAGCDGFTLLEMLVVVGIAAMLAVVGGGLYAGTLGSERVRQGAREFVLAANYARQLSIEKQQVCRIAVSPGRQGFDLILMPGNSSMRGSEGVAVRNEYFKPVRLAGDVRVENMMIVPAMRGSGFGGAGNILSAGGAGDGGAGVTTAGRSSENQAAGNRSFERESGGTIGFYPDGTADAATVQIGDGGTHYTVQIFSPTGRTEVVFGIAEMQQHVVDLDMQ